MSKKLSRRERDRLNNQRFNTPEAKKRKWEKEKELAEKFRCFEYGAIEPFCGEPLVDYYKRKCRIKYNGEIACALTPDDPIDEEALKEAVYLFAKENGMDFDPR